MFGNHKFIPLALVIVTVGVMLWRAGGKGGKMQDQLQAELNEQHDRFARSLDEASAAVVAFQRRALDAEKSLQEQVRANAAQTKDLVDTQKALADTEQSLLETQRSLVSAQAALTRATQGGGAKAGVSTEAAGINSVQSPGLPRSEEVRAKQRELEAITSQVEQVALEIRDTHSTFQSTWNYFVQLLRTIDDTRRAAGPKGAAATFVPPVAPKVLGDDLPEFAEADRALGAALDRSGAVDALQKEIVRRTGILRNLRNGLEDLRAQIERTNSSIIAQQAVLTGLQTKTR